MRTVYVDNNATTEVSREVVEEMIPYFSRYYGNPSSMHFFGSQAEKALLDAREKVAVFLGAEPSEIVFTSCGTESDNAAIRGAIEAYPEKKHIITTRVEHPAVLNLCQYLGKRGYRITELGVDRQGKLDLDELRDAIDDDTVLVSIMHANNETGMIFPVREAGKIIKSHGITFHCDAVQAAGKIPIDMAEGTIDLLSLSGHKLHAPKGVGALYIRKGTRFSSFLIGGHQEKGRRGGTENVPYIVGLGKACSLAADNMAKEYPRLTKMRDRLEAGLLTKCPNARINGDRKNRLPNTLSISFEYVEGESILLLLNEKGIGASSGSACTSGSLEPSHVLRAMGIPFTAVHGSIRFSLSKYNTNQDIDYILEVLPPMIQRLREISPFGKD